MSNRSKATDKRGQFWTSIRNQKLDGLRWVMLHSGLNIAGLEDDNGKTGLMIASEENKPRALLVMLDIMRQKRELKEAIDRPDEDGRTPLMLAAGRGFLECVDHLVYYGASTKLKDRKGLTPRDHAVASRFKPCIEYFDEAEAEAAEAAKGGSNREAGDGLDADGLTSTQRSKLKKKQMKEAERGTMMAAILAAAAAKGDEMPEGLDDEEDEGVGGSGGGGSAAGKGTASDKDAGALPPLPSPAPSARWSDITTVLVEKRRELKVDWTAKAPSDGEKGVGGAGGELEIDPALWHAGLLNRLEIRLGPGLISLPPLLGHLSLLQTLIVSGNGLTVLPPQLAALTDLKFLDVSRNALTVLPGAIGKLAKLEVLDVSDNKLATLDELRPLTGLTSIQANRNALTDISQSLAWEKLVRLDTLSLTHNGLTALPDEIGALQALSVLNVADNAIEELPAGMADLNVKKVKDLTLLPNPIADKKVLKAINKEDKKEAVKELFKVLASGGGGGKKGGKGKK